MQYILGIHIGHDATAALVNSKGEIVAAVGEERLSRFKAHSGFPYKAIENVLKIAGISKQEVGVVASSTKRRLHPYTPEWNDLMLGKHEQNFDISNDFLNSRITWQLLVKNLGFGKVGSNGLASIEEIEKFTYTEEKKVIDSIGLGHAEFHKIEHHHCHATSAYYTSGYNDAMIITIDGAGDGLCATANIIENDKIKRISSASADISPGTFYAEITRFLGYKRNRHEGKITGLAAYGDPNKYYKSLKEYIHFVPEKECFNANLTTNKSSIIRKYNTLIRILNKENTGNIYIDNFFEVLKRNYNPKEDAKDLSAAAQELTEDIVVEYIQHFRNKYPLKNVALAGGIFANVKVNQKIAELPGVESVYIHQNMGDGGCAAGAAFSYY